MINMPPQEQIQFYVQAAEELIHNDYGWTGTGHILTLGILDENTMAVYEVPMTLSAHADRDFASIARELNNNQPGTDIVMARLLDEQTVGFVLVYEKTLPAQRKGVTRRLITDPDNPSNAPTRIAFGMDILGRVYYASRRRGEKPEHYTRLNNPVLYGALPSAMRLLNVMVAERMPEASRYLAALGQLEILSDEKLDQQIRDSSHRIKRAGS